MLKRILFTLFFFNTCVAFCQRLPVLDRQQMLADFDTLTKTLIEVSPQVSVRKKVTGLDLTVQLALLRNKIDQCKSTADFGALIKQAILMCQDGHTSLLWKGYNATLQEYLDEGISREAAELLPLYDSVLRIPARPFNLGLKYIKGEYYTIGGFTYKDREFASGMKLLQCDGVNIHDYAQGLLGSVSMMRWDFENNRYFSENLFRGYHLRSQDAVKLVFKAGDGQLISSSFLLSDTLSYGREANQPVGNMWADTFKTVEYFSKERILYIRVPKMDLEYLNYYQAMIREKGRNKRIKKVIIDIRNNPGGADNVWTDILKSLILKPITYKNVLLCNNSATIRSKLLGSSPDAKPYPVSFLNNYQYIPYSIGEATLLPDSTSLGYDGKIYVIQNDNIYSSAGSFTAVAVLAENLVTVGSPTGRLLGRGINPLVFELPFSKILYRVEPVIDFLNVQDAEDVFHDKVEIPVELTVTDYLDRRLAGKIVYTRDYLLKHDPVFRKIVSLK